MTQSVSHLEAKEYGQAPALKKLQDGLRGGVGLSERRHTGLLQDLQTSQLHLLKREVGVGDAAAGSLVVVLGGGQVVHLERKPLLEVTDASQARGQVLNGCFDASQRPRRLRYGVERPAGAIKDRSTRDTGKQPTPACIRTIRNRINRHCEIIFCGRRVARLEVEGDVCGGEEGTAVELGSAKDVTDFGGQLVELVFDGIAFFGAHGVVGSLDDFFLHGLEDVHDGVEAAFGDGKQGFGVADVGQGLFLAADFGFEFSGDRVAGRVVFGAVDAAAGGQAQLAQAEFAVGALQVGVGLQRLQVRVDPAQISHGGPPLRFN
jgi:hypothetical protein